MNVNKWGPGGWIFLHTITFNYPTEPTIEHKKNYSNFFESIGEMLPCKYCRQSYEIYYKYLPITEFLDSREGVVYWFYKIHELVNQKTYKENASLEDVIRFYEDFRAKCGTMSKDKDKDKKYKTCQKEESKINIEYLNMFINKALTYKPKIDAMIKKMYKSDENPNKEYLKNTKKIENGIYPIKYFNNIK